LERNELELVRATVAHAEAMAPRMRAADRAEILASGGYEPLPCLLESLKRSTQAWAACFAGEPMAMFGVRVTEVPGQAVFWMLTGDLIEEHQAGFVLMVHELIPILLQTYGSLTNWCDARYGRALRFFRHLGCRIEDAQPFGLAGLPFHRVTLAQEDARV
jgi:hypothetical protein